MQERSCNDAHVLSIRIGKILSNYEEIAIFEITINCFTSYLETECEGENNRKEGNDQICLTFRPPKGKHQP